MAFELTAPESPETLRDSSARPLATFNWSSVDTHRITCPCETVPCIDDLDSWWPFTQWLERATAHVDLQSKFRRCPEVAVALGWLGIEDPDAPLGAQAHGRLAVSAESRALVGSYESSTTGRRVDPIEQRATAGGFDDLESGAVALAFDTGVALPTALEIAWAGCYWRSESPRVLRRVATAVEEYGSRLGVSSTLQDRHAVRCLVWLAQNEPAAFESFVLSDLEPRCERRHLRSLRAAVAAEARLHESGLRRRRQHEQVCAPEVRGNPPAQIVERVLEAIAHFVQENTERIWRGRLASGRSGRHDWVGRWDHRPGAPIALDADVVRTIVGRFGDPQQVIRLLGERKLLRPGPTGLRSQQRVGSRRRSVYTFLPAAVPLCPSQL